MRTMSFPIALPRLVSRQTLLRHFAFACAGSLYLAFGALMYAVAGTVASSLEPTLAYFGAQVLSLGLYFVAAMIWVGVLPTFANFAASEIRQQP